MRRKRGQITVFAALMFLVIMGLVFCVLEGIRSYLTGGLFEDALACAENEVRACYDIPLFERYHLFFLDPRESDLISDDVRKYINDYFSEDSFFGWTCRSVRISEQVRATDLEGEPLRSEIRAWMKYKREGPGEKGRDQSLRDLIRAASKDFRQAAGTKRRLGSLSSGRTSDISSAQDEDGENVESHEEILWKEMHEAFDTVSGSDLLMVCGVSQKGVSPLSVRQSKLPSAGKGSGLGSGNGRDRFPRVDAEKGSSFSGIITKESCGDAHSPLLEADQDMKEYIHESFSCFTTENQKEEEGTALRYEREYLLWGKRSDKENLKSTVSRIFMIRFLTNYLSARKDPGICAGAEKIAGKAAGKEGLPDSEKDAETVLIAVLSYGETIMDMRRLMTGKRVRAEKGRGSFYLTFDSYAGRIRSGKTGKRGGSVSYEDYLDLLLTSEKLKGLYLYRIMDLMQMNVRLTEPGFQMSRSLYSFSCAAEAESPRWYPMIPGFGIRFGRSQKLSCRKKFTY